MAISCDIELTVRSGGKARGFTLKSRFAARDSSVVLFGPSGSGKTLTLRAVAGLLTPEQGTITVGGRTLLDTAGGIDLPARARAVGYVFQDYALFPHLTVRENVAFGLRGALGRFFGLARLSRAASRSVADMLGLLGLRDLADCHPADISGGQRQRVALARALVRGPEMLLLDEPFSALDQPLRRRMREEVARVLEQFNLPLLLVTHDLDDLSFFAGTVVAYRQGRVSQVCAGQDAVRFREAVERDPDGEWLGAATPSGEQRAGRVSPDQTPGRCRPDTP